MFHIFPKLFSKCKNAVKCMCALKGENRREEKRIGFQSGSVIH